MGPAAPVAAAAPVDPAAPVVPLGPDYNKIKIQKQIFRFRKFSILFSFTFWCLLGFFTGTGTTAGVPCVDGGGPVPSKSCGGCVLVKKGRNQVGAIGTSQIPLYTVQSWINYKTRKKGVSPTSFISLFNFLFLCVSSLQVERPSIYTTQQKMQNQSVKLLDSYWFQIQILKKKERRKRERRIFIL